MNTTSRGNDRPAVTQPFQVAILAGDGIGIEVTAEAVRTLAALEEATDELQFELQHHSVGAGEYLRNGNPLPEAAFKGCLEADAVLLGAMGLPTVRWKDGREMTPQIDLRERLDLYAGIRPLRLYHECDTPLKGLAAGQIDLVIVRENCEGLFSARQSVSDPLSGEVRDVMRVSRRGVERICRVAFELARTRRKKCTLVDKANVLPSMVFFRSIFQEIATEYSDVQSECFYVDAMALYLVQRPESFDVIVTENMFGDILSDLGAGLVGGMGMAPSADIGSDCAVFQPSHGTAPDIAGKNLANPIAMILSTAMMLEWLREPPAVRGAELIRSAVQDVLENPRNRTRDCGGQLQTGEMTDLVISAIHRRARQARPSRAG